MKSVLTLLFACFVFIIQAQTPSKPTNPFPNRNPTPAPTSKPSTPAPTPVPAPSTKPSTPTPTPVPSSKPSTPVPAPSTPSSTPSTPTSIPKPNTPTPVPGPTVPTPVPATPGPVPSGSTTALPPITGTDQEQIMATVMRVFDGMKAMDSNRIRPLFAPNCRLFTATTNAYGTPTLIEEPIASFIKSVGTPRKEIVDERIIKSKVDIDGLLASVWADYNLYIDSKFYHCGVDVFHLYKSTSGWKIFELADTRRTTGCNTSTSTSGSTSPDAEIASLLDSWHRNAATSNSDAYFAAFAADGIFLGTDPGERWTKDQFKAWAKPQFDAKQGWNFTPSKRHTVFSADNTIAWVDEELATDMGACRGAGVLSKQSDGWKIKQYSITILVPNEKLQDYMKLIGK